MSKRLFTELYTSSSVLHGRNGMAPQYTGQLSSASAVVVPPTPEPVIPIFTFTINRLDPIKSGNDYSVSFDFSEITDGYDNFNMDSLIFIATHTTDPNYTSHTFEFNDVNMNSNEYFNLPNLSPDTEYTLFFYIEKIGYSMNNIPIEIPLSTFKTPPMYTQAEIEALLVSGLSIQMDDSAEDGYTLVIGELNATPQAFVISGNLSKLSSTGTVLGTAAGVLGFTYAHTPQTSTIRRRMAKSGRALTEDVTHQHGWFTDEEQWHAWSIFATMANGAVVDLGQSSVIHVPSTVSYYSLGSVTVIPGVLSDPTGYDLDFSEIVSDFRNYDVFITNTVAYPSGAVDPAIDLGNVGTIQEDDTSIRFVNNPMFDYDHGGALVLQTHNLNVTFMTTGLFTQAMLSVSVQVTNIPEVVPTGWVLVHRDVIGDLFTSMVVETTNANAPDVFDSKYSIISDLRDTTNVFSNGDGDFKTGGTYLFRLVPYVNIADVRILPDSATAYLQWEQANKPTDHHDNRSTMGLANVVHQDIGGFTQSFDGLALSKTDHGAHNYTWMHGNAANWFYAVGQRIQNESWLLFNWATPYQKTAKEELWMWRGPKPSNVPPPVIHPQIPTLIANADIIVIARVVPWSGGRDMFGIFDQDYDGSVPGKYWEAGGAANEIWGWVDFGTSYTFTMFDLWQRITDAARAPDHTKMITDFRLHFTDTLPAGVSGNSGQMASDAIDTIKFSTDFSGSSSTDWQYVDPGGTKSNGTTLGGTGDDTFGMAQTATGGYHQFYLENVASTAVRTGRYMYFEGSPWDTTNRQAKINEIRLFGHAA